MKTISMNPAFFYKRITVLIIALLPISGSVFGQADSSMNKIAQEHMYPFTLDKSFDGEGWEMIEEIAQGHKYFLIGEDHGLAEIPLFTKELVTQVSYDLFVTEIDSVSASLCQQIVSKPDGQMDSFHADNPSALSFYSAKEEFEIMKELSKSGADIWGLDQVSLFATGIVFKRLSEICSSKKAKELTASLANLSDKSFIEATKTGNYDTLFMFSSKQDVFDNLTEVLRNESQEAKNILSDIETSWKIYNGIGKANHFTRIAGMKSKLLNYYLNDAQNEKRHKKVLYKFGAYHVGKSESVFGGYDVGNFVSNLAEAEGESAYHLMIVGKKGVTNSFLLAEGMESMPFDITDKESELYGLLPLSNLVEGENWVFFNLKPLRKLIKKGRLNVEDSFLRKTINGYDGLVIIPETTPSKALYKSRL